MQVTYTQGAPPNMFMKDADGNTIEEIGIANWKVEHIEEFRAPRPAPPRTKNTHPSAPPRQFGAALPATPATTSCVLWQLPRSSPRRPSRERGQTVGDVHDARCQILPLEVALR